MKKVKFFNARYKGAVMNDMEFDLHQPYNSETGCITVWADPRILPETELPRKCRIRVSDGDYEIIGDDKKLVEAVVESDDEALARIRMSFEHLERFTAAVVRGDITGLVVSGAAGIGKSFAVQQILQDSAIPTDYEIVGGTISPVFLYQKLYAYSGKGQVLVLDDCEFEDPEALNVLKKALDSSKTRTVSWWKNSTLLMSEGIPPTFEFQGSVIFLTNVGMTDRRGIIGKHLDAIVSRCHYLDLDMDASRYKLLRIRQMVDDGMLDRYNFTTFEKDDIVSFVFKHCDNFLELSLRMVTKIADIKIGFPADWENMVISSCMNRTAKNNYVFFDKVLD